MIIANSDSGRLPRVIGRYGGKGNFAKDYEKYIRDIADANDCNTFVDFFGGGGTMCMLALRMRDLSTNKYLFSKVIYNDIDKSMTNLFRTVKDPDKCCKLVEMLLMTPYSREMYDKAHERINAIREGTMKASDLVTAYYAFVESRMSFNSACQSYRKNEAYENEGVGVNFEKVFQKRALELLDMPQLLQRLVIREGSYIDLIHDNAKGELFDYNRSVLFFDCPYYQPERAAEVVYKDEMGDLEHVVLIQALSQLKHWMLCGYQSGNVQGWQSRVYGVLDCFKDIRKVDLGMKHRPSGSRKAEADDPHEILWIRK